MSDFLAQKRLSDQRRAELELSTLLTLLGMRKAVMLRTMKYSKALIRRTPLPKRPSLARH